MTYFKKTRRGLKLHRKPNRNSTANLRAALLKSLGFWLCVARNSHCKAHQKKTEFNFRIRVFSREMLWSNKSNKMQMYYFYYFILLGIYYKTPTFLSRFKGMWNLRPGLWLSSLSVKNRRKSKKLIGLDITLGKPYRNCTSALRICIFGKFRV